MTRSMLILSMLMSLGALANAEDSCAHKTVCTEEDRPHHLSVIVGGTYVDAADVTEFTLGIDYEYRLTPLLGLGFVAEHAFGEIDATTLLAVADIHLVKGLAVQIGPGIEITPDEEFAIGRLGLLYEFEIGHDYTLSPQLHFDLSSGEDAVVFGLAFGRAF